MTGIVRKLMLELRTLIRPI